MVPTYATQNLAYLAQNLNKIIGKNDSNNIKVYFTKSWKIYFDDCFIFGKRQ